MEQLIRSRERVETFAEVFTPAHIVKAMVNLPGLKEDSSRIDSRVVDLACGNGNFLAEILSRRLAKLARQPKKNFERDLFRAVSNLYGIDIIQDNCIECRGRLLEMACAVYDKKFRSKVDNKAKGALSYVLSNNIVWADTLNSRVVFPEWAFVGFRSVKRTDYAFKFSESGEPKPVRKEYPIVWYKEVSDVG